MYNRRNTLGAKFNAELQTLRDEEYADAPGRLLARHDDERRRRRLGALGRLGAPLLPAPTSLIRSSTVARYGEEALPADGDVVDWPFTYEDLEPFYTKAEYALGICGAGLPGRRRSWSMPSVAMPLEADRSAPFPMPPLRSFGWGERFQEAARRLGLHPFIVPAGVNSVPYDGRPACTYCGFCSGYGCYNDAKASTLVTTIPKAIASGHFDLRPFARASAHQHRRLREGDECRLRRPGGTLERIEAQVFLLCRLHHRERPAAVPLRDRTPSPRGSGTTTGCSASSS